MNRRGFTLIELLAVIVIIGILGVLIAPNILTSIDKSKESSYEILVKNIVTSSQMYYEECEYGDLSSDEKYGSYACSISGNSITVNLGTLANTGFLKVSDTKDGSDEKVVINPKDDSDISDCEVKIEKKLITNTDTNGTNGIENYKVTYIVRSATSNSKCPTTNEYNGVE